MLPLTIANLGDIIKTTMYGETLARFKKHSKKDQVG
jgi:hypothetical protein